MLTLRSGASSIVVAPEHGAGMTGWMIGTTPTLRRALPQASVAGDPHAMACFPILPYCNRIGHGRFYWRGIDHQLKRNFGDHSYSIHGIGWQRAWAVVEAGSQSISLELGHSPDESWPFAFAATVRYGLIGTVLTVAIRLTNRHDAPAPAGIGVHPYFPKMHNPTLRLNATGTWESGSDALPSRHGPVPAGWVHADPRPVAESRLDHCFTGWDGAADIQAGPASLRIEASTVFRHLQVFTPSWADFFCVEPVSHVPDAISRPALPSDQAMHVLEPGETLAGTVRLASGTA
jgi:aldose 1-epimerase